MRKMLMEPRTLTEEEARQVEGLVWAVVRRRFRTVPSHVAEPEDLYQYAMEGVARAVRRFDGDRSGFTTWATSAAHHAIQDALRRLNPGWRTGRQLRFGPSLDAPLPDGRRGTLADVVPDDRAVDLDLRIAVDQAVAALAPREQAAIRLRFHHDLRLRDVAEWLGISESRASQLVSAGLRRMRTPLAA